MGGESFSCFQNIMRRIVYIQHSAGLVGAPTSLLFLIESLDQSRFLPTVLFSSAGPAAKLFKARSIEVKVETGLSIFGHAIAGRPRFRSVRPWQPITGWFSLISGIAGYIKALKPLQPDLVHVNSSLLPSAALAAKILGVPVVWHIREQLYHGLWGVRQRAFKKLIESAADKIIVLSEASRNQFAKVEKISIIYNFVNFDAFDRQIDGAIIRQKLDLPSSAKVLGFLGGLLPHKGGLTLLEAMIDVQRKMPETHLIVLGNTSLDTPSPSKIKRRIRPIVERTLNLYTPESFNLKFACVPIQENIHLVGAQSNVPDWIAACDLIVFPSTCDHFARPIIEAGAMAKPIVASDWPSTREIVEPGPTGILVPPNAPQALAEAIVTLLQDEQKSRLMGEAGYQQARHKFNAKVQVEKVVRIYDEILSI